MKKCFDRSSSIFFTAVLSSFLLIGTPAQTVGQSRDWEKEWETTIRAARNIPKAKVMRRRSLRDHRDEPLRGGESMNDGNFPPRP